MIEGKWLPPGAEISSVLALRQDIFVKAQDDIDSLAWQVLVFHKSVPCGIGRIWWQEGEFHIGFIGVLNAYRHQGMGDLVVRLLLFKAQQHNASRIVLSCPKEIGPFFERYGFRPQNIPDLSGNVVYALSEQEIALDACSGCAHSQRA